jgi:spermidine synthase
VFRFYEINPDMIRFAEGEGGYFSFVSDSKAETQVVAGDAGLSLENELSTPGPQDFDVLVLDAFSGDAVPLHLLTREAFEVYLQHLAPDGVLAVNVSNRYFDLSLQVYRLAEAFGLQAMKIEDRGDALQSYDSIWMLLYRSQAARRPRRTETAVATPPGCGCGRMTTAICSRSCAEPNR